MTKSSTSKTSLRSSFSFLRFIEPNLSNKHTNPSAFRFSQPVKSKLSYYKLSGKVSANYCSNSSLKLSDSMIIIYCFFIWCWSLNVCFISLIIYKSKFGLNQLFCYLINVKLKKSPWWTILKCVLILYRNSYIALF